jgi:phosphonate transport system ATP-binding protein
MDFSPALPELDDSPADCLRNPHISTHCLGLKRGDDWLFRDMKWQVPRGKFIAVVGPSGIGKSSLLRVLSGIEKATEGTVTYSCRKGCTHTAGQYQKKLGIVFQNLRLTSSSTLLRNVLCGRLGRYRWWNTCLGFPQTDREEACAILECLGLGHRTHSWAGEVSGGEQQRTAVARALFQQPEVILADEPVSQLDSALAHTVLRAIKDCVADTQSTALVVLHDRALVDAYADLVLSLDPTEAGKWTIRELPASDRTSTNGSSPQP